MAEEIKKDKRVKYESKEAAKAAARKIRHQWDKENYEISTVYMPKGMNARLKAAADKLGIAKRAFTVNALEKAIRETLGEKSD